MQTNDSNEQQKAPTTVGSGDLLGRWNVHLPNFLPATMPVACAVIICRWFYCDSVFYWLTIFILTMHALCGGADIMANHYRQKLKMLNRPNEKS